MAIKVLLADDHASLRAGFRALLEAAGDFDILDEIGNGDEAVARARELVPDIVVMDVAMPGINGIDATREIISADSPVRVLALSGHNDGIFIRQMLEAGARAVTCLRTWRLPNWYRLSGPSPRGASMSAHRWSTP